jgi:hypothetical protein
MSNRIVKDFNGWNLITEISDIVGATGPTLNTAAGGAGSDTAKTSGGVAKAEYVPPPKTGGGFRGSTVATTTEAPAQPASQETLNKLATDIANMIVALFVDGNPIWSGENALKLDAKGTFDDTEEDGVKIFDNYWATNITPKINMLPAGDKNKTNLTALQAQISKSILAGGTSALPFGIVTIVNNKPVAKNYTINTDF